MKYIVEATTGPAVGPLFYGDPLFESEDAANAWAKDIFYAYMVHPVREQAALTSRELNG